MKTRLPQAFDKSLQLHSNRDERNSEVIYNMTDQYLAYIGTYTDGASEGIYGYRFDATTGALEHVSTTSAIDNPSFLDISPSGRHLYAVCADFEAMSGGLVKAYAIDSQTGELTYLNEQSSEGDGPCHISIDPSGKYAMVANYGSGSVSMLPIEQGGLLGKATGFDQHEGSSVDPDRQMGPHAHSIILDANNRYAFAADLGTDKMMVYRLDFAIGALVPNDSPWVRTPPGAGPRHFDFHPNGKFAYIINEMGSSITALHYDAERGMLNEIETVPTLPEGFDGVSYCADIHVTPSGKFVYGSNRGHDSIAIFAIDQSTGALTALGHQSTMGGTPRNFVIDPSGAYMLAANQDTDNIITLRIDQQTGMLEPTGHEVTVGSPVCIKLLAV